MIEWFAGINCTLLQSQIWCYCEAFVSFYYNTSLVLLWHVNGAVKRVFVTVMIQFMVANHSNTNPVISIFIHSAKSISKTFSFCCYLALIMTWRRCWSQGINTMTLKLKIIDFIANENAFYNSNEFQYLSHNTKLLAGCLWRCYPLMSNIHMRFFC